MPMAHIVKRAEFVTGFTITDCIYINDELMLAAGGKGINESNRGYVIVVLIDNVTSVFECISRYVKREAEERMWLPKPR